MVLADDVVVEELVDLRRLGQLVEADLGRLGEFLLDDVVAEVDALVADVDAGPGDELLDLLLRLAAEGALHEIAHRLRTSPPIPPPSPTPRLPRWARCAAPGRDHLVDDAVLLRLGGAHDEVAVGVLARPLDRLAGVVGQHLVEQLAHAQDLLGLDLDVGGLAGGAAVGLVDQDPGVRAGRSACPWCRRPAARRRPRRPGRSRTSECRA